MFHSWFISIIANRAIKSPRTVTTATWFRYFFLYASSLPDWIYTPITPQFSWQVFWGVYQVLEELNVILPWTGDSWHYLSLQITRKCEKHQVVYTGLGRARKGSYVWKSVSWEWAWELGVILEASDLTRLISTWFHDQSLRCFSCPIWLYLQKLDISMIMIVVGGKLIFFIIFARINTQFLHGSPKSQELSNIYTF